LVLPFWYRLTWVVPDKGLLNGCVFRLLRRDLVAVVGRHDLNDVGLYAVVEEHLLRVDVIDDHVIRTDHVTDGTA